MKNFLIAIVVSFISISSMSAVAGDWLRDIENAADGLNEIGGMLDTGMKTTRKLLGTEDDYRESGIDYVKGRQLQRDQNAKMYRQWGDENLRRGGYSGNQAGTAYSSYAGNGVGSSNPYTMGAQGGSNYGNFQRGNAEEMNATSHKLNSFGF